MPFKDILKGKKILITGNTGFKGSWLTIWLHQLGAEVFGYALPALTDRDNFLICGIGKNLNQQYEDIRNLSKLKMYFKEVKPDIAFHLAAQPLVLDSFKNPVETYETNIMGTVNFFEAVRSTPSVKVAINVTSDKCYQNNEWIWGYRESDRIGGKDPYSCSKGCSELITYSYIQSFFQNTECLTVSVRSGNVIGPGDWSKNRIIPDLFRAYDVDESLNIRNPDSTRPWQHVLEPLSGYLDLASKLYAGEKQLVSGWNFGPKDGTNYTVMYLIETILENVSVKVKYDSPQTKIKESNLLKLDISKSINELKWSPVLEFKDAINLTVSGYLSDLEKKDALMNRIDQINYYTNKAREQKIEWSLEQK